MPKHSSFAPLAGLIVGLACVQMPYRIRAQAAPAAGASKTVATVEERRKAMSQVFDDSWEDGLRHAPEFASSLGDKRFNDQLADYSERAVHEGLERDREFLKRLLAIDTTGFTSQEIVSRDLFVRGVREEEEGEQFKEWEMPIDQTGGIHTYYPDLARQLSFTTVKDYDDWIARLHAMPMGFEQATDNMTKGIADHRMPPKFLLAKALDQVKDLAHQKPEDSPLSSPLKSFPASVSAANQTRIRAQMLDVIAKEVMPAYVKFEHFVESTYLPAGRDELGVSSLPNGAKYYEFLIRRHTTTRLTAERIHQIGLDEVARNEADMLVIAKQLGFADLKTFQASIKANPKLHPASPEALLDAFRNYLNPMQAKLPSLFGRLPKAQLEVTTIPDFRAKTAAAAYYESGAPDGSRPGRITVNLYNATERSLVDVEAIAYHEGIPGHHLQITIGQELDGIPKFRKFGGYTAFVEGWALYSEHLGKDVGFYKDPYSDYGRLEADTWRAIRLVIDTGVHSQHWTRAQMIDYFRAHSGMDETNIQSEVDRYIGWPGQALAYKIGQLKILELRDRAKKALGDKFDIRAFHDEVLDSGALPLDVLESRVNDWIAGQTGIK